MRAERMQKIKTGRQWQSVIAVLGMVGVLLTGCGDGSGGSSGSGASSLSTSGSGSQGQGGSTARFTIVDNYLYTLSGNTIRTFDVQNPADPKESTPVGVAWNIETIFPYRDYLFIGSETGVFIYDIKDRASPTFLAESFHVRSCDPVVVQNDLAYVTLRTGTFCGGNTNRLDILDVSQIASPRVIGSYPMSAPFGLAIDGPNLFVCDGTAGLKLFNVVDAKTIKFVSRASQLTCFDVIARKERLYTTGGSGIVQLDYALQVFSTIPTGQ